MKKLLNNKLFVVFVAPFFLGAFTILGFSPFNFTLINFFTFSILLFLVEVVKKRNQSRYRKKKIIDFSFILVVLLDLAFFYLVIIGFLSHLRMMQCLKV